MVEVLAITILGASGVLVSSLVDRRLPRVAVAALAFPIGATIYAIAASIGLVVTSRLQPAPLLGVTLLAGVGCLVLAAAKGRMAPGFGRFASLVVASVAALATFFWFVPLTRLTIDSIRYLLSAADLQLPGGVAVVQPADLMKRQLALPAWQTFASFTERRYVAGVGPLFGFSGIVFLGWLIWARGALEPARRRSMLLAAAVLFTLASNRLLYDWFYINTHIEMAVLMLVAVAGLWMAAVDDEPAWWLPAGLGLAGMLLLRAEATLVVALVLVAAAPAMRSRAARWVTLTPVLIVGAAWYAVTLWRHASGGSIVALDAPVFMGMVAVGGASLVVVAAGFEATEWLAGLAHRLLLPTMALALVVYTIVEPSITFDSIVDTARNVGYQGLWAFAWSVGTPLLLLSVVVHRIPLGRVWATVIVGYGLLFFLLPHLRGSPWRLGSGDSGNRILAHVFLVAVAFMVLAAMERHRDTHGTVEGQQPIATD